MHFIKTGVSSKKFRAVSSKSKAFLRNESFEEFFKLKSLHVIA